MKLKGPLSVFLFGYQFYEKVGFKNVEFIKEI